MEIGETIKVTDERRTIFPGYYPPTLQRITCLYVSKDCSGLYDLHDWSWVMYKWCKQGGSWTREW